MQNLSIFVDFDGTISRKDIGDQLFIDFGDFDVLHHQLKSGEINIKDYWKLIFATLKPNFSIEGIDEYLSNFGIDAYFSKFVNYCTESNYKLTIVSDGFDAYIHPFLKLHDINGVRTYCNSMIKKEDKYEPLFTYSAESCSCMCASCKRNAILNEAGPDDIIIYIGDGYSDFCTAEHSDIIFAKKHLAAYLTKNRIPHYPFSNFFDIIRILKNVVTKKSLKPRHQAFLKRKKAFEVE